MFRRLPHSRTVGQQVADDLVNGTRYGNDPNSIILSPDCIIERVRQVVQGYDRSWGRMNDFNHAERMEAVREMRADRERAAAKAKNRAKAKAAKAKAKLAAAAKASAKAQSKAKAMASPGVRGLKRNHTV